MNFLTSNRNVVIFAAAVIVLFAIVNSLDLRNQTFVGFSTDTNNKVIQVRQDSPADRAGFAVGDRVVENGGISVTDSKALSRRPRSESIGR